VEVVPAKRKHALLPRHASRLAIASTNTITAVSPRPESLLGSASLVFLTGFPASGLNHPAKLSWHNHFGTKKIFPRWQTREQGLETHLDPFNAGRRRGRWIAYVSEPEGERRSLLCKTGLHLMNKARCLWAIAFRGSRVVSR